MDCSLPGSSVHGSLQARILEWVAMPSSRDSPDPGITPTSPSLAGEFLTSEPPGKPIIKLKRRDFIVPVEKKSRDFCLSLLFLTTFTFWKTRYVFLSALQHKNAFLADLGAVFSNIHIKINSTSPPTPSVSLRR